MARRRARYLAPLALVGVIVATLLVVSSGLHSSTSKAPAKTVTNGDTSHTAPRVHRAHHRASYVVRSGDTLTSIAVRTGVPVATLESLNPGVNPSALQTGQRLKLR